MMEWQWHQLDYMQFICTSLQTDNHSITSTLSFLLSYSNGGPVNTRHGLILFKILTPYKITYLLIFIPSTSPHADSSFQNPFTIRPD